MAALQAIDGSPLAHIAAHGHHEPENPLFSSLDLVDGSLMGYDLQQLRQPPRHVVLSACELGLASIRAGDEVLGMAAALLAAGAANVVAGVSSVRDQTAPDVMIRYHQLLRAGETPSRALADASIDQPLATFVCFGAG